MEAVRVLMSVASSALVGSAMGEAMEAVEDEDEAGGVVAGGGGAGMEEDLLEPDTRLSRASTPKAGGPWLLSS